MPSTTTPNLRVWDLPTRIFHWSLAVCVVALIVTGKAGSSAMQWHMRLGHVVLALIAFRILWGFVGGHWSRFVTFIPSPMHLVRYLRGETRASDRAGHSPLGALSVLAFLLLIGLQVLSGLLTDDEMFYAGALVAHAPSEWIELAGAWHVENGPPLVIGIIALHVLALLYYGIIKKRRLVPAMLHGDKNGLPQELLPSRDGAAQRFTALILMLGCGLGSYWIFTLG